MFQKLFAKVKRWTSRTEIKAVNGENSTKFLYSLGIINQGQSGDLSCSICGKHIELDKWEMLGRLNSEFVFCCSNSGCLNKFIKLFREE